jgi:uncharacterized membrane protein (UPF0127 family)
VARTREERTKGLMFRKSLDEDKGMLFIFAKEGIYYIWMKNTLIPLDIIWINKNKEAIFIHENAQPCKVEICPRMASRTKASYVLELNAGTVQKTGLAVGDKLEFDIK